MASQTLRNGARYIKKSDGLLCKRNEVKCSFITHHKKIWSVVLMCHVLGVKTNNYYSYQKRNTNKINGATHQEMIELVKGIAKFSDNTYGERRIKAVLNALSFPVSRCKVAKLMKEANVWVRYKKKYKVTTNSEYNKPLYKNELEQNFTTEQPNQALVGILLIFGQQKVGSI